MTVLAHPLNIIMQSKTHLIGLRLAAGLRPDPLEENFQHSRDPRSYGQRTGFKDSGTKRRRWQKINGKKKHRSPPKFDTIVVPALDFWYSSTAYIDVRPLHFLSGSTPVPAQLPTVEFFTSFVNSVFF